MAAGALAIMSAFQGSWTKMGQRQNGPTSQLGKLPLRNILRIFCTTLNLWSQGDSLATRQWGEAGKCQVLVGCIAFPNKNLIPKKGRIGPRYTTQKWGGSSSLYGQHLNQEGDRRELGRQIPPARYPTCGVVLEPGLKEEGHPCRGGAPITWEGQEGKDGGNPSGTWAPYPIQRVPSLHRSLLTWPLPREAIPDHRLSVSGLLSLSSTPYYLGLFFLYGVCHHL